MPVRDGVAKLTGMIPLDLTREGLSVRSAKAFLGERAGDYVRVIGFGLECADPLDRVAYGVLAVELAHVIELCGQAVETGQVLRVAFPDLDDAEERVVLAQMLARICAARPENSTGAFGSVYGEISRQIARLLEEPKAAA